MKATKHVYYQISLKLNIISESNVFYRITFTKIEWNDNNLTSLWKEEYGRNILLNGRYMLQWSIYLPFTKFSEDAFFILVGCEWVWFTGLPSFRAWFNCWSNFGLSTWLKEKLPCILLLGIRFFSFVGSKLFLPVSSPKYGSTDIFRPHTFWPSILPRALKGRHSFVEI